MDYEEILLQISDVLREHNRVVMTISHKEAVEKIGDIIHKAEAEAEAER